MPAAAFFDLDKTILSRSSALALARPLFRAGLIGRADLVRSAYAQFSLVTGRIDHAAMERMRDRLSELMTGWDAEALRSVIAEHLSGIVMPLVFPQARDLISAHQAAGDAVVVVTSTGTDMALPIGALLGADHVLATRMGELDGRFTGVVEDFMYGARKAEAIREYASAHGLDLQQCAAYSDSVTDLPMLTAVGRPHAVNPDRRLRRTARREGWPVLEFGPRLGRLRNAPHPTRHRSEWILRVGIGASVIGLAAATIGLALHRHRARRPPAITGRP